MPILFWWKPNNTPVAERDSRKDIGLELGGDETAISRAADGRIELVEVGGSGRDNGEAESADPRLMAVFHGTFHRDPKASPLLGTPITDTPPYVGAGKKQTGTYVGP